MGGVGVKIGYIGLVRNKPLLLPIVIISNEFKNQQK